jgi:hypothetical protein
LDTTFGICNTIGKISLVFRRLMNLAAYRGHAAAEVLPAPPANESVDLPITGPSILDLLLSNPQLPRNFISDT